MRKSLALQPTNLPRPSFIKSSKSPNSGSPSRRRSGMSLLSGKDEKYSLGFKRLENICNIKKKQAFSDKKPTEHFSVPSAFNKIKIWANPSLVQESLIHLLRNSRLTKGKVAWIFLRNVKPELDPFYKPKKPIIELVSPPKERVRSEDRTKQVLNNLCKTQKQKVFLGFVQLVLVGLTHKSKEGEIRILNLLFKKLHFSHQKFAKVILDGIVKKKKLESLVTTLVLNLNKYSSQHTTHAFNQISRSAHNQKHLASEKSKTNDHRQTIDQQKATTLTIKAITLHSALQKIVVKKFALGFRSIEFIARFSYENEQIALDRDIVGQMGVIVGGMVKSKVDRFFESGLEYIGQREKGLGRLETVFSEQMKGHWRGLGRGAWLRGEKSAVFEKVV